MYVVLVTLESNTADSRPHRNSYYLNPGTGYSGLIHTLGGIPSLYSGMLLEVSLMVAVTISPETICIKVSGCVFRYFR